MKRSLTSLLLLSSLGLPCTEGLAQQSSPAAPPTTRQFGGWALNCQRVDARDTMCELVQSVMDAQQRLVLRLAVGTKSRQDQNVAAVAQLPVNVSFSEPPKLTFGTHVTSLVYRSCTTGGCIAEAVLPAVMLNVLKDKTSVGGVIEFRDSTGRPVQFPLSSGGFSQAWPAYLSANALGSRR